MIRRGDVYFANLDPVRGREQSGRRPVVVVSTDALNALDLVVTVVVGTAEDRPRRTYRTNVWIPKEETGLPRDTTFLCFQIRSVDPQRFFDPRWNGAHRTGTLSPARLAEIDAGLRAALDL